MDVRRAVFESTEDIEQFELKAVEALLSVSSKSLVSRPSQSHAKRGFEQSHSVRRLARSRAHDVVLGFGASGNVDRSRCQGGRVCGCD